MAYKSLSFGTVGALAGLYERSLPVHLLNMNAINGDDECKGCRGRICLPRSIMFSRSCSLSCCDLSYIRLMAACQDNNVLLDLKVGRKKSVAPFISRITERWLVNWAVEICWMRAASCWMREFSLLFFFFSETWLILGKFSLKETHSWYGYAAVRALRHYFLNVKCSWVFLWNVTLAFLCVGGKKSFFFTPVGLDIVYSKSGIRNNSCHIYIQMTFKRSYFVVWAPIPMQFLQVYSLQSGMPTAKQFCSKNEKN